MIEFALLFGLGFLSAALAVMLIAPAVHKRVVRYTENRIKATMPISPQEVRAQRDMARAVYAAENARTKQELVEERDRTVALQLKNDSLADDAKRLQSQNTDLRVHIETLDTEAASVRSRLRDGDSLVQQVKASLETSQEKSAAKDLEIENLKQRQMRLIADADNLRIDLSTRDTEVENLKFRMNAMRDERDGLRNDVRMQTTRAKDAEVKLAQEENRVQRLEDKLAREMSDRADKEAAMERRQEEIDRLRDRLKMVTAEARGASRAMRDAVNARPTVKSVSPKKKIMPEDINLRQLPHDVPEKPQKKAATPDKSEMAPAIAALAEDASSRATALSERLQKGDVSNAEAVRQELAAIAANMVAMTAANEGSASPIHKILSGKSGGERRESLAARSKRNLSSAQSAGE